MVVEMEATALRFARAARAVAPPIRARGLLVPGFRSPPRLPDVDRSLRRRPAGGVMVSIRIRGRPWLAVLADMVEGVVAGNSLAGPEADALRRDLWNVLDQGGLLPSVEPEPPRRARHLALAQDPEAA
jgi:hypothetical protein